MSGPSDGGPAFPASGHPGKQFIEQEGMSLRDWFAGQALGAIIVLQIEAVKAGMPATNLGEQSASQAFELADAMLAHRNKATP